MNKNIQIWIARPKADQDDLRVLIGKTNEDLIAMIKHDHMIDEESKEYSEEDLKEAGNCYNISYETISYSDEFDLILAGINLQQAEMV